MQKNCYNYRNYSIIETPEPPKMMLISDHYSKYILKIDDSAQMQRKKKLHGFKLKESIQTSSLMTRRKKGSNSIKNIHKLIIMNN